MTFLHSKTSAKTLHAGPGKMEEAGAGEKMVWALSPEARPVVSSTRWWEGSSLADRTRNRLRATLLLPRSRALRSGLSSCQRRAEAVARETGLAVQRGARPLPRPTHLRRPALAALRPAEGQRGEGAEGLRGALQPTCGPGQRHRGDKDTRNHHSRCCRRHRKRLSGSATTGRKLPLSRIWSLPRLRRPLPSPTPACHPAATGERKCAFPDRMRVRKSRLGSVLAKESHQKRRLRIIGSELKESGSQAPQTRDPPRLPTTPASLWQSRLQQIRKPAPS
nr:uncharacterized protein LOC129491663 [Symphalangus syndactylus]